MYMANKNFDFVPVYPIEVYRNWLAEQDEQSAKNIMVNSNMWNRLHLSIVTEAYEQWKKFSESAGREAESFEAFQFVSYVIHAFHAMEDSIVRSEIEAMTKVGE